MMLSQLSHHNIVGNDVDITSICIDSRKAQKGSLYCALNGFSVDGHDYISKAIDAGAIAVAVEDEAKLPSDINAVPYIVDVELRNHIGVMAAAFYQQPSQSLQVFAVTGTNGKTSVVNFIQQLLQLHNKHCATIGTLGVNSQAELPSDALLNTTPDAVSLQQSLAAILTAGEQAVAMEVSSHALDQSRCAAVAINTAIFTNLSHDHLDYHQNMANYFAAKKQLFQWPNLSLAIINKDDAYYDQLAESIGDQAKLLSYSLTDTTADIYLSAVQYQAASITATLHYAGYQAAIESHLIGDFNLLNVLASFAAVFEYLKEDAIDESTLFAGLANSIEQLTSIRGRMQLVTGNKATMAVVDYAHTPDALEKALQAFEHYQCDKKITVFGCGGDRDNAKRPLMAAIAERYSDYVIVTDDNPRTELPEQISQQIIAGFSGDAFTYIADRKAAIETAVNMAGTNDIVLVAGKGHETYQQFANERIAFDDADVLFNALQVAA